MNSNELVDQLRVLLRGRDERIRELESGSCRFHCRTAKSVFLAGFDAGMCQHVHWNDRHEAYAAFQQQNGEGDE